MPRRLLACAGCRLRVHGYCLNPPEEMESLEAGGGSESDVTGGEDENVQLKEPQEAVKERPVRKSGRRRAGKERKTERERAKELEKEREIEREKEREKERVKGEKKKRAKRKRERERERERGVPWLCPACRGKRIQPAKELAASADSDDEIVEICTEAADASAPPDAVRLPPSKRRKYLDEEAKIEAAPVDDAMDDWKKSAVRRAAQAFADTRDAEGSEAAVPTFYFPEKTSPVASRLKAPTASPEFRWDSKKGRVEGASRARMAKAAKAAKSQAQPPTQVEQIFREEMLAAEKALAAERAGKKMSKKKFAADVRKGKKTAVENSATPQQARSQAVPVPGGGKQTVYAAYVPMSPTETVWHYPRSTAPGAMVADGGDGQQGGPVAVPQAPHGGGGSQQPPRQMASKYSHREKPLVAPRSAGPMTVGAGGSNVHQEWSLPPLRPGLGNVAPASAPPNSTKGNNAARLASLPRLPVKQSRVGKGGKPRPPGLASPVVPKRGRPQQVEGGEPLGTMGQYGPAIMPKRGRPIVRNGISQQSSPLSYSKQKPSGTFDDPPMTQQPRGGGGSDHSGETGRLPPTRPVSVGEPSSPPGYRNGPAPVGPFHSANAAPSPVPPGRIAGGIFHANNRPVEGAGQHYAYANQGRAVNPSMSGPSSYIAAAHKNSADRGYAQPREVSQSYPVSPPILPVPGYRGIYESRNGREFRQRNAARESRGVQAGGYQSYPPSYGFDKPSSVPVSVYDQQQQYPDISYGSVGRTFDNAAAPGGRYAGGRNEYPHEPLSKYPVPGGFIEERLRPVNTAGSGSGGYMPPPSGAGGMQHGQIPRHPIDGAMPSLQRNGQTFDARGGTSGPLNGEQARQYSYRPHAPQDGIQYSAAQHAPVGNYHGQYGGQHQQPMPMQPQSRVQHPAPMQQPIQQPIQQQAMQAMPRVQPVAAMEPECASRWKSSNLDRSGQRELPPVSSLLAAHCKAPLNPR